MFVGRAKFSLTRALFRINLEPIPNIRIARLTSHDTHSDSVVVIDIFFKDSHNIIICTQKVWSLRQQNYLNYPTFTEYS